MQSATKGALAFPPFTAARRVRAELVASILRAGRVVPDDTFDEIYPEAVRRASWVHWTPVDVCARVVGFLQLPPDSLLLDVGAGAGKFCIVAAAMSRSRLRGIEKRPELTATAREAARRVGIDVEIVDGTLDGEDARAFDGAYLFNPFTDPVPLPGVVDDSSSTSVADDIAAAKRFLDAARPGIRVVTYCGYGGKVPSCYDRLAHETWHGGALELWEKRAIAAVKPRAIHHRRNVAMRHVARDLAKCTTGAGSNDE